MEYDANIPSYSYPAAEAGGGSKDEIDAWFRAGFAEHPELDQLTSKWAHGTEVALDRLLAEELHGPQPYRPPEQRHPEVHLGPLGTEVKKLFYLFTNPENPENDSVYNEDIAAFILTMHHEVGGDIDQLVARVHRFTRDAYSLYIPSLSEGMWSEMYRWQMFWAVYGAMKLNPTTNDRLP